MHDIIDIIDYVAGAFSGPFFREGFKIAVPLLMREREESKATQLALQPAREWRAAGKPAGSGKTTSISLGKRCDVLSVCGRQRERNLGGTLS